MHICFGFDILEPHVLKQLTASNVLIYASWCPTSWFCLREKRPKWARLCQWLVLNQRLANSPSPTLRLSDKLIPSLPGYNPYAMVSVLLKWFFLTQQLPIFRWPVVDFICCFCSSLITSRQCPTARSLQISSSSNYLLFFWNSTFFEWSGVSN